MSGNKQIQKFIYNYEGIISKEDMPDVWSIYKIEDDGKNTHISSLQDQLFHIRLHTSTIPADNFYCIEHGHLYNLLAEPRGIRHLAKLV